MYKIVEPGHVYITCKQNMSNIQLKQDNMNDKPTKFKIIFSFDSLLNSKLIGKINYFTG